MSDDLNIIQIVVEDREGERHELEGPTDMNMNMMELCKSYELPVEGTCGGMAMCASCHMYVTSDHDLAERSEDEEDMLVPMVLNSMEKAMDLSVPLVVDYGIGNNWFEAH